MLMGLGMVGVTVATVIAGVATGSVPVSQALSQMGSLGLIGAAAFAYGALRLPRWARLRQTQMQDLSERLARLPTEPDHA